MLPNRVFVQLCAGQDGGHDYICKEIANEDRDGTFYLPYPNLQFVLQFFKESAYWMGVVYLQQILQYLSAHISCVFFSPLLHDVVKGIDFLLCAQHLPHYWVTFGFCYEERVALVYNIRLNIFLRVLKARLWPCSLRNWLAGTDFFIFDTLQLS